MGAVTEAKQKRRARWGALILLAVVLLIPGRSEALDQRSTFLPAEQSPLADRTLLLGTAQAGNRIVAVGAHGHVLLSDDYGETWRQAKEVPTQATLTAVSFLDERQGFAVGYDAVILHTEDAGETWAMRYVDIDKGDPLFGIAFLDARHGIAVGALGLVLESTDGGRRWSERLLRRGDVDDLSLNAIVRSGDSLYVPSEFGIVWRSANRGASFFPVQAPTNAALLAGLVLPDGMLVFCGTDGQVWRARSDLSGWTRLETKSKSPFTAMTLTLDGRLAIAGGDGVLVFGSVGATRLTAGAAPARFDFSALVPGPRGKLVVFGERGILLTADRPFPD